MREIKTDCEAAEQRAGRLRIALRPCEYLRGLQRAIPREESCVAATDGKIMSARGRSRSCGGVVPPALVSGSFRRLYDSQLLHFTETSFTPASILRPTFAVGTSGRTG
ncbi:hypothetical protein AAFF_G00280370 [Aldrovandia affinis]|uniref:Uncharacterized protein n=1 Tax=Aldrovandia affinis TaxID=143900 RepID=A0AAD7W200_9TELE|nr:hypothetical protein AAFF_G00280370 [Aldrovandia affinis]